MKVKKQMILYSRGIGQIEEIYFVGKRRQSAEPRNQDLEIDNPLENRNVLSYNSTPGKLKR